MLDQSFDQVKQQQERKAVEAYSSGLTFEKAKKRKKKQRNRQLDCEVGRAEMGAA